MRFAITQNSLDKALQLSFHNNRKWYSAWDKPWIMTHSCKFAKIGRWYPTHQVIHSMTFVRGSISFHWWLKQRTHVINHTTKSLALTWWPVMSYVTIHGDCVVWLKLDVAWKMSAKNVHNSILLHNHGKSNVTSTLRRTPTHIWQFITSTIKLTDKWIK